MKKQIPLIVAVDRNIHYKYGKHGVKAKTSFAI
jgi:hypothetical protein